MIYKTISFIIACVSFSELENDTLNQAELNEIKINENNYGPDNPCLAKNEKKINISKSLSIIYLENIISNL
jgi:hypothetical protein